MPFNEHLCPHTNEIIDEHEGSIVCTNCGLVLSSVFKNYVNNFQFENKQKHQLNNLTNIDELLQKLNKPTGFSDKIYNNLSSMENINKKENKKNKKELLPYAVYSTLNELKSPISIKDISAVSGFNDSKIYKMQQNNTSIFLQPEDLLEKFTKLLNFDYKTYTVIKEDLPKNKTGHNPLTIVGTIIYLYCKRNKLKYSIKKIATLVGTSPISIQRYLKVHKK